MRFFVTIDQNRHIISTMITHDLSAEYIAENSLIEVSEQDFMNIEPLTADHEVIIDIDGSLKAFQKLDHGIDRAKQRLNQYVTTFIEEGFVFNNMLFKCSSFDQQNITNKAGIGGRYKTADKKYIHLTTEQSIALRETMALYINQVMEIVWDCKDNLEHCNSFEEIDIVVNSGISHLIDFKNDYINKENSVVTYVNIVDDIITPAITVMAM